MSGTVVTRCEPPLPIVTPLGAGLAHWRIERGIELPTFYEVWICEGAHSGEIWEFPQHVLTAPENTTAGRVKA
jgi:hypothetical protein